MSARQKPQGALAREVRGRLRWLGGHSFAFTPDEADATFADYPGPLYVDGHVRVTPAEVSFHEVVPRTSPVRQPVVERPTMAVELKTTRRYIAKTTKVMRSEIFATTTWGDLWRIMDDYDREAERAVLTRQRRAQNVREEVARHGL